MDPVPPTRSNSCSCKTRNRAICVSQLRSQMRFVKKDAFCGGRSIEDRGKLGADAAADVGDYGELFPVVSGGDAWCHGHTGRPHRAVHGWTGPERSQACLSTPFLGPAWGSGRIGAGM